MEPNLKLKIEDRIRFLEELDVEFFSYDFSNDWDVVDIGRFFDYLKREKRIVQDAWSYNRANHKRFNGGGKEGVIALACPGGDLYDLAERVVERVGFEGEFNAEVRAIYDFPLERFSDLVSKGYGFVLPCLKGQSR